MVRARRHRRSDAQRLLRQRDAPDRALAGRHPAVFQRPSRPPAKQCAHFAAARLSLRFPRDPGDLPSPHFYHPLHHLWQPFRYRIYLHSRLVVALARFPRRSVLLAARIVFVDTSPLAGFRRAGLVSLARTASGHASARRSRGVLFVHRLLSRLGGHFLLRKPLFHIAYPAIHSWARLSARAHVGALPHATCGNRRGLGRARRFRVVERGVHVSVGHPPGSRARTYFLEADDSQPVFRRAAATIRAPAELFVSPSRPHAPDRTARYRSGETT